MRYEVRALSPDHLMVELTIDACDEVDARSQIAAQGLYPTVIAQAAPAFATRSRHPEGRQGRLSLTLFSQELLALLDAGLSLVESLQALLEKESNAGTRAVLARLLTGLREGRRFSAVLAEQPALFPPLYIGIVTAAEGTSDLPRSLGRYIEYRQRLESVRGKLVSASIYPLILFAVGTGVCTFLIAYVVPRFAEVYQGSGRDMPWLSEMLLGWGRFLSANGGTVFPLAALGLLLAAWGLHRLVAQEGWAALLVRVPGLAARIRIVELSRLYLTLGMLLEGGISVVAAIDTVEGIVSARLRERLKAARRLIESGLPLSQAFDEHGLCTPISLRMLRVGEHTGELGRMLTQSAAFYDGEIGRWIDRFMRTFEPVLMAIIGVIVGAIVVLLYMPIFDLAGGLS
ncbi:type II secretion system protein F (GspF) [Crenobacter luteus]|uniref:type II secretion system F family protein n=1 Tax=Crenobacter luteus TaxID=1452487 RepID=UPI00104DDC61|nr:type II secretion system F family protein [Crenobacter luteus]TCP10616.1 type II secretion system protein F (GspF) [Crenobacter luteus]